LDSNAVTLTGITFAITTPQLLQEDEVRRIALKLGLTDAVRGRLPQAAGHLLVKLLGGASPAVNAVPSDDYDARGDIELVASGDCSVGDLESLACALQQAGAPQCAAQLYIAAAQTGAPLEQLAHFLAHLLQTRPHGDSARMKPWVQQTLAAEVFAMGAFHVNASPQHRGLWLAHFQDHSRNFGFIRQHWTVRRACERIVKEQLACAAARYDTPLGKQGAMVLLQALLESAHSARIGGMFPKVLALLEDLAYADPDGPAYASCLANANLGAQPQALLVRACVEGDLQKVAAFLHRGLAPDAMGRHRTPLAAAACNGQLDTMQLLLKEGAGLEAVDSQGCTPFHLACGAGQLQAARWLGDHGANPQQADAAGQTPFMAACMSGQLHVIDWLLTQDPNVDDVDRHGNSALMLAARAGEAGSVRILLQRGANASLVDADGDSALQLAIARRQNAPPDKQYQAVIDLLSGAAATGL
jgi:ankyrin repeat protein